MPTLKDMQCNTEPELPENCSSSDWRFQTRQCSKLTFSKGCLLATFNCKMVAIKRYSVAKKKENAKGRTLHDILHNDKKGKTLHDIVHEGLMRRTAGFQQFTFATVSLRIHVEFLNYER